MNTFFFLPSKKDPVQVISHLDWYMQANDDTSYGLAKRIGSSERTIEEIRLGRLVPSVYTALLLSNYYGCSVNQLFHLEVKES